MQDVSSCRTHASGVEVIRKASTELHGLTAGVHHLRWLTTACYRVRLQKWLQIAVCVQAQMRSDRLPGERPVPGTPQVVLAASRVGSGSYWSVGLNGVVLVSVINHQDSNMIVSVKPTGVVMVTTTGLFFSIFGSNLILITISSCTLNLSGSISSAWELS